MSRKPASQESNLLILLIATIILFIISVFSLELPFGSQISQSTAQNSASTIRDIARNIYQKCRNQQAICYEDSVSKQLLSFYSTRQILQALYDYDTYFSCHAFTHFLGRALYKRLQSIPDAYSQINFTCHGGAYHGVIEAYLDQQKTSLEKLDGETLHQICADSRRLTDKNPEQVYTECLHGFGHAFMFITDSDLPASLAYCDRLQTVDRRERCYGGAFMENSTSSTNLDHPSKWIRAGDKFFPCTVLSPQYQKQCYFYQSNYLIKITDHNYQAVFGDCDLLSGSHREYCVLGLGANLASFSNERGISKATAVCSLGRANADYICIEGAIPSLFARYGGEVAKIIQFCDSVKSNLSDVCFAKIGQVAQGWYKNSEEVAKICERVPVSYQKACIGTSNVKLRF